MDDTVRTECQVTGSFCPGYGGRIGAKISTKRAASFTEGTRIALRAPLLHMDFLRFGEMSTPALDDMTIRIFVHDATPDLRLHTIHFPGRKEFAIGQGFQTVVITAYPGKSLYMTVPGSQIIVTDRPFVNAVACRAFKFKTAPSLRLPGPQQAFATDLIPTDPVKRFFLDVGMLFVFDKKMLRRVVESITPANDRVIIQHLPW